MQLPRTPSFRLDGRKALVTGAGRGIGLAAAVALAEAGAELTLVARTADEVEELAAAIRANGGVATAVPLDVTDTGGVRQMVSGHGPFPILINNAGTNCPAPFEKVTEEDYDALMGLNVRAAFFVAQAVAGSLLEAGLPGSIVNMSSQMGHVGWRERSVYCATKHALEGITKSMAWDLGSHGIRVNTLCPTYIETPMTKPMLTDAEFMKAVVSKIALGRIGQPEDVMGAIVFLASDASALITGSAILVDGGWTAA